MRELRPYRVRMRNGFVTNLLLYPETAARDYPDAVELKVEQAEVKAVSRKRAPRKTAGGAK